MLEPGRLLRVGTAVLAWTLILAPAGGTSVRAATGEEIQARIARDLSAGRPVVVHVVVALCDNENQGIVRVPSHLGNGQDPRSNLYWGALFGLRTFFTRQGGWTSLSAPRPGDPRILDRAVLFSEIQRAGHPVPVYVVADAWDGREMRPAIETFLTFAAGGGPERVSFRRDSRDEIVSAGGASHLVAFVGHNGLMDFSLDPPPQRSEPVNSGNSSIVLACASKPYFLDRLRAVGSHPLLLTTGLMAPEAYTLDAAIRSWAGGGSLAAVHEAAATAYQRFQKCGIRGARSLFWGESR